jgi:hypothetical protein
MKERMTEMSEQSQELIIVKQLPIIEERLKTIKGQIQAQVKEALALDCTEETVKEIKKVRAELSSGFKSLETQRKEVKSKVLAPYEQFEVIYKECVTNVYTPADAELKSRIDEVEDTVRNARRKEIVAFFDDYAKSKGIEFLEFERMGIQVLLTTTAKSLKATAKACVDRIADELALIDTQKHKEEILVEYRQSLNAVSAITSVTQHHEAIEAERRRTEEARIERERRAEADEEADEEAARNAAEIAAAAPPPEEIPQSPENEETATDDADTGPAPAASEVPEIPDTPDTDHEKPSMAVFAVYGTPKQLNALKEFLDNGGYKYKAQ